MPEIDGIERVSVRNNATGYWVKFEAESKSSSGELLTSCIISHFNLEKRTIRGLMTTQSIKCLRQTLS